MITSDKRYGIMARDFWTCQRCGATGQDKLSLAHRIKSGKGSEDFLIKFFREAYKISLQRKQAQDILDHEDNLITACRGKCNSDCNIFFDPVLSTMLVKQIAEKLKII